MKEYIGILKKSRLFAGIGEQEIESMLSCLDARLCRYKKGEYVIRSGEHVRFITVLVEGELYIQTEDYWGNRTIVNHVSIGEMFGESYVSPDNCIMHNDVVAVRDSAVVFFYVNKILNLCPSACRFHSVTLKNLFYAISDKNHMLVSKLAVMSCRTTREKLLAYFSDESKKQGSSEITVPFNRQQMADYLSVDRSAMSNELCKMRNDGIIEFDRNTFLLKQPK